jgi:hypothetical protein
MEGLLVFVWILGIVWSILCIILFFKVWGMCNNVSSILQILLDKEVEEEKPLPQRPQQKQKKVNIPKRTIKASEDKQDAMMAFNDDCLKLFKQCKSKEEFDNAVDEIIAEYNKDGNFDYSTLKDGLWEQFKLL